jgi:hypothetical protein
MFCSGAGLADRALITVGAPKSLLVDVDLRRNAANIRFDGTGWKTKAFCETNTSNATFEDAIVSEAVLSVTRAGMSIDPAFGTVPVVPQLVGRVGLSD